MRHVIICPFHGRQEGTPCKAARKFDKVEKTLDGIKCPVPGCTIDSITSECPGLPDEKKKGDD